MSEEFVFSSGVFKVNYPEAEGHCFTIKAFELLRYRKTCIVKGGQEAEIDTTIK